MTHNFLLRSAVDRLYYFLFLSSKRSALNFLSILILLFVSLSLPKLSLAQQTSQLWGHHGELWSPESRLPDFSVAGYRMGNDPIPNIPVVMNVKDFGAKGDGITDNSQAFIDAIASTKNGTLFIPEGRYVIRKVLEIKTHNIVLRGAGQGKTTLYFPLSLSDILGRRDGRWSFIHALIDFSGIDESANLSGVGIEDLTIEFPNVPYAGHLREAGYNAIWFWASNCWVRNVTIINSDIAVNLAGAKFCTVDNIRITGRGGHHGFRLSGAQTNLIQNFSIENVSVHDITVQSQAYLNVFSNGSGRDINFDHHGTNPNDNLFTNIDVGAGSRIHESSGNDSVHSGRGETFWNIKLPTGHAAISYCPWPQCTVVGATHSNFSGDLWMEGIKPASLFPQNIYEAQLARRLEGSPPPPPAQAPASTPTSPAAPPFPASATASSSSVSPGGIVALTSTTVTPATGVIRPYTGTSLINSATIMGHSNNFASDHPVEHLWDSCLEGTPKCTAGAGDIASFWMEFDLGKLHDLTSARLFGDADGNWSSTSWTLEYKQTLKDPWSTAFKNVNAFFNDWSTQSLATTARYVRVTVFGNQSKRATQARELELYGTPRNDELTQVNASPATVSPVTVSPVATSPVTTNPVNTLTSLQRPSLINSATMTRNSQNFDSNHPVEYLWDGCLEGTPECTAGAGNIASFWIEFDLGKLHDLILARLFGDADHNWWSTTWTLEYKQNLGDPWSVAFSNANAFLNGWSTQHLSIPARYVRVEVFGNESLRATQARELELYGSPR